MADITVSVAAPGAVQASRDLDHVAASADKAMLHARKLKAELRDGISRGSVIGGMPGGGRAIGDVSSLALGGMSKLAAGITVGTAAIGAGLQVFAHYVERASELLQKEAEGHAKYIDMQLKARQQLGASALAAAGSKGDAYRQLIAVGGQAAMGDANRMAANGITGAHEGMAYAIASGRGTNASISAAETASRTGIVSFSEAIRMAIDQGMDDASTILTEKLGRRVSGSELEKMISNVSGSKLGGSLIAIDKVTGVGDVKTQDNIIKMGERQARENMAALIDPLSKAILDSFNEANTKLYEMQKVAEKESAIYKLWENLTSGKGSLQVQVLRGQNDLAAGMPSN